MKWKSQLKSILSNIDHENNTKLNIFEGYHTRTIQEKSNRHCSKNIVYWWTTGEETHKHIGCYCIQLISIV